MDPIDAGAGEHATGSQEFVGSRSSAARRWWPWVGEDVVSRSVGAQRVVRPTVREHREHRRPDEMDNQRADRRQVTARMLCVVLSA